ncbi:MAG: sulfatase-like hydrolase/transferase [Sphingomonas sp.]|uniref:sulfatase-like hydrolase/transferase n=1 Tax=Sphingomonas sp. TaxID=28214 RepID=UPI003F2AB84C
MKRWRGWLAALGVMAAVVAIGLWQFGKGIPGFIGELRHPIAAYHPVSWNEGPATPPVGQRPPNIILILADDLGYNDISLNGGGVAGGIVKTPNIDSIAHDGVSYATAYAANATCSPSRAALMTGRYPTRFGFEFTAVPGSFAWAVSHGEGHSPVPVIYHGELNHDLIDYPEMGVPRSEITIAQLLKRQGYHTLHFGKWHLGEADDLAPHARGFDESLGFRAGGSKYLHQRDPNAVNAYLPWDPIDGYLWPNLPYAVQFNNGQRFEPNEHMTDYLTDNAIAAIHANRNRPFFMYLAYNAPHTPLQATKADYDALPMISDHKTRVYGAMVRQLDRRIGDVLATLKKEGLDQNTLVIFTSDNGGAWYDGIPDLNKPFRGWKATFFEGGIRVPLMMRWLGHIQPGTTSTTRAIHMDLFATMAAAADAPLPKDRVMDGVDVLAGIVPGLAPSERSKPLFWRSGGYRAVRDGDWKLQVDGRQQKVWLYNLANDPTERHELSAAEPAQVARLKAELEAHNQGMAKPLWPGLIEAPVRIDVPLNAKWDKGQDYVYWTN